MRGGFSFFSSEHSLVLHIISHATRAEKSRKGELWPAKEHVQAHTPNTSAEAVGRGCFAAWVAHDDVFSFSFFFPLPCYVVHTAFSIPLCLSAFLCVTSTSSSLVSYSCASDVRSVVKATHSRCSLSFFRSPPSSPLFFVSSLNLTHSLSLTLPDFPLGLSGSA